MFDLRSHRYFIMQLVILLAYALSTRFVSCLHHVFVSSVFKSLAYALFVLCHIGVLWFVVAAANDSCRKNKIL